MAQLGFFSACSKQLFISEIVFDSVLISGLIDSSGIRLYVSDVLKNMDAGIMELGLEYTDKMAIPPKLTQFPLIGYCVSECTAVVIFLKYA